MAEGTEKRKAAGSREQNRIWKVLVEQCMEGNLQAIKLYFELQGRKGGEALEQAVQIIDDLI